MKSQYINKFKCVFPAKSINEGFARATVASFFSQLDPKVSDISDLKTAVSEAVTNCIVHAYKDDCYTNKDKLIYISCEYGRDKKAIITVKDKGKGISNIEKAMTPLYTSSPEEERSGMGFTVMESLCDEVKVRSVYGKGTTVVLIKRIRD